MESQCSSLLLEIQVEVAHYVLNNIWTEECHEGYREEIRKPKENKCVACMMFPKKLDHEDYFQFDFDALSQNTMILHKLEKDTFRYIKAAEYSHGRRGIRVTLNKAAVTACILNFDIGLKKIKETIVTDDSKDVSIVYHNDLFTGKKVGDIRAYFLCSVTENILTRMGRKVSTFLLCKGELMEIHQNIGDTISFDMESLKIKKPTPPTAISILTTSASKTAILNSLRKCKYCESEIRKSEENKNTVEINLKKYLENEIKPKGNFFNDINKIKDLETTDFVQNVAAINSIKSSSLLLHIVPSRIQYKVKSVALLQNLLYPKQFNRQILSVYEARILIILKDGEEDFESWLKSRKSELWSSYCSRYGTEIQGPGWERIISKLAKSSTKLDVYATSLNKEVIIRTSKENFTSQKSMFILYNYARLCKIEENFQNKVKEGVYEPLPDIQTMDFSELKEDLEWCLIIRHVLKYHLLMKDLATHFESSSVLCSVKIPVEKLYSYLSNLCRDVSKYYKQTKVLLDPQSHLISLLHARVYLISVIRKIMEDCFDILGIEAPKQM